MKSSARSISTISYNVASAIVSGSHFGLDQFFSQAPDGTWIMLAHYNFFYSYPEWGKRWVNGKDHESHRVNTMCHVCGSLPDRNFAGIGTIYLVKSSDSNRVLLMCRNHIAGYKEWAASPLESERKFTQLELFAAWG